MNAPEQLNDLFTDLQRAAIRFLRTFLRGKIRDLSGDLEDIVHDLCLGCWRPRTFDYLQSQQDVLSRGLLPRGDPATG